MATWPDEVQRDIFVLHPSSRHDVVLGAFNYSASATPFLESVSPSVKSAAMSTWVRLNGGWLCGGTQVVLGALVLVEEPVECVLSAVWAQPPQIPVTEPIIGPMLDVCTLRYQARLLEGL